MALLRERHGVNSRAATALKPNVFRIGHIGYYDVFDIVTALAAVELGLVELGADIARGAAASRVFDAFETWPVELERPRVLVREQIAAAGIDLLRARFDVDEDTDSELAEIIGRYDAIVVRSGTQVDADPDRLARSCM